MKNPITYLEESINHLKGIFEEGIKPPKKYFNEAFISKLEVDSKAALQWCEQLDDSINEPKSHATRLLLLSDLIYAYSKLENKEKAKSRFVLAYYYDVLKHKVFGNKANCESWNILVDQSDFTQYLQNIKKDNIINDGSGIINFKLAHNKSKQLDSALEHVEKFIQSSFDLKFKDSENRTAFFQMEENGKPAFEKEMNQKEDSLEIVMAELNGLIGLDNVKKDVNNLINLLKIQKKRESIGLKNSDISLHAVFLGPPGTGKTTVARLLARIYKQIGLLDGGQLYETDREGLVAGYMGQTASKVDGVVKESMGGVLFIDEAYALTQYSMGNDYGSEAINTLLKRMEDYRDNLSVVVAGYSEPMKEFIESNPGLRSRFNRYFYFDHFTPDQMLAIFESFCKKSNFVLTKEAIDKLSDTFELLYEKRDANFGNARVVRNIFEKCIQNQANRLVKIKKLSKSLLKRIEESDIPDPKETVNQVFVTLE